MILYIKYIFNFFKNLLDNKFYYLKLKFFIIILKLYYKNINFYFSLNNNKKKFFYNKYVH